MKKYKIITLCGSTRFKDEFTDIEKKLTMQGNIVLSLCLFMHTDDKERFDSLNDDERQKLLSMLDEMHREKIRMSDEVFVVNKCGYIGTATKNEIAYATKLGKPIRYLESCSVS